jgi:hypothetical protein
MNLICIPALKKHKSHIQFNLCRLNKSFNECRIIIVTPDKDDYSDLSAENISIFEDNQFEDIQKEKIKELLNLDKKNFYLWYYQQFLKYSIIKKLFKNYDVITIVDADSVILNENLLSPNKIFLNENEYHTEYFMTIKKLFPQITTLNQSSINNFQTFTKDIFLNMIKTIEIDDRKWYIRILEFVNESKDPRAFSEYETYANYASFFYEVNNLPLRLFRRGDLLSIYQSKAKIIYNLEFLEYDIVAFETNHDIKISHFLFSFYLFLVCNIKVFMKKLIIFLEKVK